MDAGTYTELVEELYAFDPKWRVHYLTTRAAASAAGALSLWLQLCAGRLAQIGCGSAGIPDYLVHAVTVSSLPYTLDAIGTVPDEEYDDGN